MEATTVRTALGPVGLVGSAAGLRRVLLPPFSERELARAARAASSSVVFVAPTAPRFAALAERIVAHLAGRRDRFGGGDALRDVVVDLGDCTEFARRVYAAARAVPPGHTTTYGGLAHALGEPPGASRAIGTALGRNPVPLIVPCHRVVGANGVGGFSSPGGLSTKAQLMALEGGSLDSADHAVSRRHLARVDRDLAPLVRAVECTLPVPRAVPRAVPTLAGAGASATGHRIFRALVRAVVGQQLSTQAARTIFGRLEAALATGHDTEGANEGGFDPARLLRLPPETLRSLGLSTAKAAAVRDLSLRVAEGRLDLAAVARLPDAGVVEALTEVRGIGAWTVEMLLVFELGRSDVLPVHDLGIRKGLARVRGLRRVPEPEEVARHAEPWRPFRSIGSFYLWRALEADERLFRRGARGSHSAQGSLFA